MWMSSGGTSSNLHYDADHNMHCLVDGRKDFIMYDPKHKEYLKFEVPTIIFKYVLANFIKII